jgi:hypothetical protein
MWPISCRLDSCDMLRENLPKWDSTDGLIRVSTSPYIQQRAAYEQYALAAFPASHVRESLRIGTFVPIPTQALPNNLEQISNQRLRHVPVPRCSRPIHLRALSNRAIKHPKSIGQRSKNEIFPHTRDWLVSGSGSEVRWKNGLKRKSGRRPLGNMVGGRYGSGELAMPL